MNAIVSRMFQAQYVDSVVTIVEMYGAILTLIKLRGGTKCPKHF